jgi:Zn-dependent peptidase ImmA (M78 family)
VPVDDGKSITLPSPESLSNDLLSRTGQSKPAVDLDRVIALWSDLVVVRESLDGDGYLVDLGAHGAEIIVAANGNPRRTRYTIAHELGHWMLRLEQVNNPLSCGTPQGRSSLIEKWCDLFAASLLMPAAWLRSDLKLAKLLGLPSFILHGYKNYNVSEQAFWLRVSQITSLSVYKIRSSERSIRVTERYESPNVRRSQLRHALTVFSSTAALKDTHPHLDSATNFIGIAAACEQSESIDTHVLCIFPRRDKMNQI